MTRLFVALFAAVSVLSAGCISSGRGGGGPVFVLGERIVLPSPGDELTVPDLIPPAKQWYLVDNVALQEWLGVTVSRNDGE